MTDAASKIPITRPLFGADEMRAVQEPLASGWVVQGPQVKRFEDLFAGFTGARHAVATTSCTTALHIAVAALGVTPGAEVIVPAFTWISTANVVEYVGATPVFCDVDLETFNIDPAAIEPLITPRTVGIIPVHLFGLSADMQPILELAAKHDLWVVEDAACALGARYHGRHAGTLGEIGCFSFHPRKSITTGEGGMITTGRDDFDRLARILRDHGASRADLDRHLGKAAFLLAEYNHLGFNYRMTDIQGALGCAQMKRVTSILAARKKRAHGYDERLARLPWLSAPLVPPEYEHGYQAYVCLFSPEEPTPDNGEWLYEQRNTLMAQLETAGISTRQGTHAPILLGYYQKKYGLLPERFPNAYLADRLSLTLPLYPQMTEEEQARVCDALEEHFQRG